MATVIEKIALRVSDVSAFSPLAMARATDAIVDTLGCLLAGTNEEATQRVRSAFINEISQGAACDVVGGGRASPSVAAMINGVSAHSLDFDDNFHPARAHASAVLVPALLSLATADAEISGRQLIQAYLAGLEAQAAVGFGVNPSHYNRGWHGTSTVGCIGTAAGVASLLGMDADGISRAMSLAASFAAGPKGQFGTLAKPLHAGMAARNAVEAALLARAGMSGRPDILECPMGFRDLVGGDQSRGWDEMQFDDSHIIETRGLVTKLHPCCASTHRAIDIVRDLRDLHGFTASDVVSVVTKVGRSAVDNLIYPDPQNAMEARFSMQYCVAAALVQPHLSLSDFTQATISRPEIRCHMPKIAMTPYSREEEMGAERLPHLASVTLTDGRILSSQRIHARGAAEDPLSQVAKRQKFSDCVHWTKARLADDLYDTFSSLETVHSFNSIWEMRRLSLID